MARLAELQERVALVVGRVQKVRAQLRAVHEGLLDEGQAATKRAGLVRPGVAGAARRGAGRGCWACWFSGWTTTGCRGHGIDHLPPPPAFRRWADELAGRKREGRKPHDDDVGRSSERCIVQRRRAGRKQLRAGPPPQGPPPDPGRVPRASSRLMAPALRFEGLLQAGVVKDYA